MSVFMLLSLYRYISSELKRILEEEEEDEEVVIGKCILACVLLKIRNNINVNFYDNKWDVPRVLYCVFC